MRSLPLLLFAHCVHAINLSFKVRNVSPSQSLQKRTSISGELVNTSNGSIPIANGQNAQYISNITLGGQVIPVLLDTGSSDLWVTGTIPGATDSGKSTKLEYAIGEAAGDIYYAPLTFDNYNVPDQAFLMVANSSSFTTNIAAQGYQGLLGLGPNKGSDIRDKLDGTKGDSVLDRIFSQNTTSANYISFLLDRKNDPGNTVTGQLTISELVVGLENITSQTQIPVVKLPGLTDADQHWQFYTDQDGIIGPDGQVISVKSIVPKAPDRQLVAVIDSGFTLPQVPRSVSDAIYGRVQGAEWNVQNSVWTIPCSQMLNISFKIGGQTYPIHPLDTSSSDFGVTFSNGEPACVGTFQPITSAFSLLGEYDLIFGMGFLRNTYTLIDYGNFVDSSSNDAGNPFIQLLSVTDVNQAHADFVNVRLGGVDTTGSAAQQLLPASQGQQSPESSKEKKEHMAEEVLSRWPYILLGSLVLFIGLVSLCVWKCCCRRRKQRAEAARMKEAKDNRSSVLNRMSMQMGPMKHSSYQNMEHRSSYPVNNPPSYYSQSQDQSQSHNSLHDYASSSHLSLHDYPSPAAHYNHHDYNQSSYAV